jgi:hypothetical protein
MVPFIGAIVAVYGLFGDTGALGAHLDQLASFLPGGAIEIVGDQLKRAAEGGKTTLGFAFLGSVAISQWSANAGVKALFDALNIVYDAKETRGLITLNAVSLAITAGAVFFLLLAISLIVVLPNALGSFGLQSATEWIVVIVRWPLLLAGIVLALAVIYRFGPCRENAQWQHRRQRGDLAGLDCFLDGVFLPRGQLRQLQQDLRIARRDDWFHDVDVALRLGRTGGGRNRRRAGARRPGHRKVALGQLEPLALQGVGRSFPPANCRVNPRPQSLGVKARPSPTRSRRQTTTRCCPR